MLSYVNRIVAIMVLMALVSCNQQEKKAKERDHKALEISKSTIGEQEYEKIRQQALDSLSTWCTEKLPAYEFVCYSRTYDLDSTLCFNSKKDRMVTAILIQCNELVCETDAAEYFYGAKIKGQWYFFTGGGTMVVLREHYQSDIHKPVSFEKLHELAMEEMFRGYIKKNADGKWEINDAFFTAHLEGLGWGDFDNQSHADTVAYGKRFTNKKEYYESIYLR